MCKSHFFFYSSSPFSFKIFGEHPLGTKYCARLGQEIFSPWATPVPARSDRYINQWCGGKSSLIMVRTQTLGISLTSMPQLEPLEKILWLFSRMSTIKLHPKDIVYNAIYFLELQMHEGITRVSQLIRRSAIHRRGGFVSIIYLRKIGLSP